MERVAVIMAGGGGLRLWPLSSPETPKHMLPLVTDNTLLRETIERILPLVGRERVLMVTTRDMAPQVAAEGRIPLHQVIVEPCRRNTAPAVALSTLYTIKHFGEETVTVVLPADHYIHPQEAFLDSVEKASQLAQEGWLVTLGIRPTRPDTGYGYMEAGPHLPHSARQVLRFTEKPDLERAKKFLAQGNFYWNSGIFIWKASVLWQELKTHLPEVAGALERVKNLSWEELSAHLDALYPQFPSISIDYAVMEKASKVAMVPASFQWCDVGSWASLWEISPKTSQGNVIRGDSVALDSQNSLIWGEGIPVKVLGVEDLIVVATHRGVLVCPRSRSQEVKRLLEE